MANRGSGTPPGSAQRCMRSGHKMVRPSPCDRTRDDVECLAAMTTHSKNKGVVADACRHLRSRAGGDGQTSLEKRS